MRIIQDTLMILFCYYKFSTARLANHVFKIREYQMITEQSKNLLKPHKIKQENDTQRVSYNRVVSLTIIRVPETCRTRPD
jgi:cellobiose phosphorylase